MQPSHPLWDEFCRRLEGPEGCDFREGENGEIVWWTCKGGRDQSLATAILKSMPDVDWQKSLEYFTEHGGHCDCEILFNVRGLHWTNQPWYFETPGKSENQPS